MRSAEASPRIAHHALAGMRAGDVRDLGTAFAIANNVPVRPPDSPRVRGRLRAIRKARVVISVALARKSTPQTPGARRASRIHQCTTNSQIIAARGRSEQRDQALLNPLATPRLAARRRVAVGRFTLQ